jgi:hypothetical protein
MPSFPSSQDPSETRSGRVIVLHATCISRDSGGALR